MARQFGQADVAAVDVFLVRAKTLRGGPPDWIDSDHDGEVQAHWDIADESGVISAHVRFKIVKRWIGYPSVSIIWGGSSIWRFDIAPPEIVKANPPSAAELGLPPFVAGSHEHAWTDNRAAILQGAPWGLPIRRPLPPQVRKVSHVLPQLALRANITLTAEQYDFEAPSKPSLLDPLYGGEQ
jgi:hypothetical protein